MRKAVRVQMTQSQYNELRRLLVAGDNAELMANGRYKHVAKFMRNATTAFMEDPGDAIERARAACPTKDCEIEIDDDAPLIRTEADGTWVGVWMRLDASEPKKDDAKVRKSAAAGKPGA